MKNKILQLRKQGKSYTEIVKELGCTKSTISYHLGKGVKRKQLQRQYHKRNEFREELKLLHGGKCKRCGYDTCLAALDFHHLSKKSFNIGMFLNAKSKIDLIAETYKCVLLCSNCHRELHAKVFTLTES